MASSLCFGHPASPSPTREIAGLADRPSLRDQFLHHTSFIAADEAANVRNFGAVGDGIKDDTAALQSALNSAYRRIYVPPGTYKLTDILRIPTRKQLTLATGAVMLRKSAATAMLLNAADGVTANYSAAVDIIVEGGEWDGNVAEFPTPCTLLGFGHTSDVIVRDCTIKNIPQWHGLELNASRRSIVERVHFEHCANEALQLDTMLSLSSAVFPWFGPYDDSICRDIIIRDCVFDDVQTALGSHSAPPIDTVLFSRCIVNDATGIAIKPMDYVRMRIEDCEFNRCGTVMSGTALNFVLQGNRINQSVTADINLTGWSDGVVERNVIFAPRFGITNAKANVVLRDNYTPTERVVVAPVLVDGGPAQSFSYDGDNRAPNPARRQVEYLPLGARPVGFVPETGASVTLSVTAAGSVPLGYQWRKDNVAIPGATSAAYAMASLGESQLAVYTVTVSNSAGSVTSAPATLKAIPPVEVPVVVPVVAAAPRLINLSVRSYVPSSGATLTAGVVVQGAGGKQVLIRAIGPTLAGFGVTQWLPNPELQILDRMGQSLGANRGWQPELEETFARVGAFPLAAGSRDAGVISELPEGAITANVQGTGAGDGLIELFDVNLAQRSRLINLSARAQVGEGHTLIAGFTLEGKGTQRILVRAVGPRLSAFGVGDALADPQLELFDAGGKPITTVVRWNGELAALFPRVGAFDLTTGSADSAALVALAAGTSYTAVVRSASNGVGQVLLEIYEVN